MPRVIAKIVTFVRWLYAPEELPSAAAVVDPRSGPVDRPGFSRWLLQGDTLQRAGAVPVPALEPQSFLRSIISLDTLSSPETGTIAPLSHPPRFWPWVLSGEELPVAEPPDRDQSVRTMFFSRLLEAETCPEHPVGDVELGPGLFRRLLAPEQCPSRPAQTPSAKKGFALWLLEHEECPVDSASAPVRRRGFWRDLFASEKL